VAPLFRQSCHVTRYRGGGVVFAPGGASCLVLIDDGKLAIIQPPGNVVEAGPVSAVELTTTPALYRRPGSSTFVLVNGRAWAVDFYHAAAAARFRSGGPGTKALIFLGVQWLATGRRARELNREFVAALLSLGAADRRSPQRGRPGWRTYPAKAGEDR
jgi:hypothetical protein